MPVFENPFPKVAQEYLDFQQQLAQAGRITMGRWKIVGSYIRLHLLPFVGESPKSRMLERSNGMTYPLWRKNDGGNVVIKKGKNGAPDEKTIVPAKDGAIRQEMMTFRAILNFAADKKYIRERQVPRGNLPPDKARREEFTPQEYRHLHTFARAVDQEGPDGNANLVPDDGLQFHAGHDQHRHAASRGEKPPLARLRHANGQARPPVRLA